MTLCASRFQPRASPRASPGHLMHVESRGVGHLAVNSVLSPGHLQTTKNLLRNMLSLFLTALRVKGFKHCRFEIRRAFIDHKRSIRAIKSFALSLFSRSGSLCISVIELKHAVMFIKKCRATDIFYTSGKGRVFDNHSRNGGAGICQQKLPAGPGI